MSVNLLSSLNAIVAREQASLMEYTQILFSWPSLVVLLHPRVSFNPLHLNIRMHILHTVLYTFPKVLKKRICLTIKSFFTCWSFPLFSWPYCFIQGWSCKEELDASHSKGLKGWATWAGERFVRGLAIIISVRPPVNLPTTSFKASHGRRNARPAALTKGLVAS